VRSTETPICIIVSSRDTRDFAAARVDAIFRTSCAPGAVNLARDGAAVTTRALLYFVAATNYCIAFSSCRLFIISHVLLFIASIRKRRLDYKMYLALQENAPECVSKRFFWIIYFQTARASNLTRIIVFCLLITHVHAHVYTHACQKQR